jgi:glucose 1-dehydrogenase
LSNRHDEWGTGRGRFMGQVCLVTGATSGIGRATAERFATEGGRVVVVGRDDAAAHEVLRGIAERGGTAIFAKADVAADARRAVQTAVDTWGRIDVLVNDAAMMTYTPIAELAEEEWDRVMAVKLRSVFLFCKYCLPHMEGGAVVNVSSVHAHETTANVVPYATSKGGLEAFTRGLSQECAASKVRVNSVAPGAVNTPMLWENPNVRSGAERIQGAVGEPADIAAAILFLASAEARFINGTTLVADGGRLNAL